jgi:hypothetical protein
MRPVSATLGVFPNLLQVEKKKKNKLETSVLEQHIPYDPYLADAADGGRWRVDAGSQRTTLALPVMRKHH